MLLRAVLCILTLRLHASSAFHDSSQLKSTKLQLEIFASLNKAGPSNGQISMNAYGPLGYGYRSQGYRSRGYGNSIDAGYSPATASSLYDYDYAYRSSSVGNDPNDSSYKHDRRYSHYLAPGRTGTPISSMTSYHRGRRGSGDGQFVGHGDRSTGRSYDYDRHWMTDRRQRHHRMPYGDRMPYGYGAGQNAHILRELNGYSIGRNLPQLPMRGFRHNYNYDY